MSGYSLHIKTITWCQEWDQNRGNVRSLSLLKLNTWSVYFSDKYLRKRPPRLNNDSMAELAGLPAPKMDWHALDMPQALKKFKAVCELYFSGPLKEKSEQEKISYLLIWSGDEGIELVSTWHLTNEEEKKLDTYWAKFESYVSPKSNFRLARYKL